MCVGGGKVKLFNKRKYWTIGMGFGLGWVDEVGLVQALRDNKERR